MTAEMLDRPLLAIRTALRNNATSAEEMTALAIERHDQVGKRLNAYKEWDPEKALNQARAADAARKCGFPTGAFAGVPVSVKDLYGVDGYPTFAGTARRLPSEWEQEGSLVSRLRGQLAVVVGKTHMVELAFGGLGTNPHWGTPVNPWDATTHRVPGGSSSGAPVSLWEGSAVVALGSDTAGSIRVPASLSGTVGHMTTYGRWPANGLVPLSPTLDVVGVLTRSVQDAAYFFAAVDPRHGHPERFLSEMESSDLSGVRIGIAGTRGWKQGQDDVVETARAALHELESHGARVVDLELPELDAAFDLYASGKIVPPECATFVEERIPNWMDLLHVTVGRRLRDASGISACEFLGALSRRRDLQATAAERLRAVDVVATPTVPFTPASLTEVEDFDEYMRQNRRITYATNPVNVLGLCAISIPCGLDRSDMPVGLQLIGRNSEDERLLAIALAAERVMGTAVDRLGVSPLGAFGKS